MNPIIHVLKRILLSYIRMKEYVIVLGQEQYFVKCMILMLRVKRVRG